MRRAAADQAQPRADHAVELDRLFADVAPGLWRTLYAFTAGRRAVADDAVAEAFARALERARSIRDPVPWLYRTALRIAAAELKRERAERSPQALPETEAMTSPGL